MQSIPHFYPVIMAGGSGTRFWPVSRKSLPKQFLKIGTKSPLIVDTLTRLEKLVYPKSTYIVAGETHQPKLHQLLGHDQYHYIVEPCARNTAACVGLAAIHVVSRDTDAIIGVLPADHHIAQVDLFHEAITHAIEGAMAGEIVTFGIKATRAETGYGYLKYAGGGVLHQSRLAVERFVEKPPQQIAQAYFESGQYLWNSGMFFFSAQRILREFEKQLPEMYAGLKKIQKSIGTHQYEQVLVDTFHQFQSVSIDVGIMENAHQVTLIPVDFAWNDVGHWAALSDFATTDEYDNVWQGEGDQVVVDSSANIIQSNKTVALLGVDHMVLVETDDVIMLCARSHTQHIKQLIQQLKKQKRDDLL